MDMPGKTPESDSGGNVPSPRSAADGLRPWTQEEMEAAVPCPMPEVPDDEPGASDVSALRIVDVHVSADRIDVSLSDGSTISVLLAGFPRLLGGTADQRGDCVVVGDGSGIRWDALGEEMSLEAILSHRQTG